MQPLNLLRKPFAHLPDRSGQLFIVGGAVRDTLLGIEPKDIDFVVVGNEDDISRIFTCRAVPAHPHAPVFTVKFAGETFEVALARTETDTGEGSEGFEFELASGIHEDLRRRDFTVNAIAVDCFDGGVSDPFGGMFDMTLNMLRPVSDRFVESPERVGRAAMMIARFGFEATAKLISVCKTMIVDFAAIPAEQMWNQFFGKMLKDGIHFTAAFEFLESVGALAVFPELVAMRDCQQSPIHHPEGDVLAHTLLTMEAAAKHEDRLLIKSVMLMHDMGKPATTEDIHDGGVITAHGHEKEHDAILTFMDRIAFPHAMREQVLCLISVHMRKNDIPNNRSRARLLRKLAASNIHFTDFESVITNDIEGRGTSDNELPEDVRDFIDFAINFKPEQTSSQSRPLIDGNDLIAAGVKQGRIFSTILNIVAECFLAGELTTKEEALELAMNIAEDDE